MAPDAPTFPFRSLPSEIRNRIYRELLCSFTSPPKKIVDPEHFNTWTPACPHLIDTAILRTNSTIYREAYDVRVKTNRFVKITCARGIPLLTMVQGLLVPIVASGKQVVNAFKGHVLSVRLGCTYPSIVANSSAGEDWLAPQEFMILHRDLV
jgi:hypothetical protein